MSVFPRPITLEELVRRGWNEIEISIDDIPCSDAYGDKFRKLSIDFEKIDDLIGKDAFRALADILNLHLEPSDKALPFRPMIIMQDKRSLALEDFEESDVDILEKIASDSNIPIVRARLCDVVWISGNNIGRKNWKYGVFAARSYLEAIRQAHELNKEFYFFAELQRGLQLAWQFRKQDESCLDDYWIFLEEVYKKAVENKNIGLVSRILRIFAEKHHSKSGEFAESAEKFSHDVSKQSLNPDISDLWDVISILWRNSGDKEKSKKALIECGENYISLGNLASSSALGALHWYEDGFECLRRGKADPDRIQDIHKKLLELGEGTLSEMVPISTEFDASEIVKSAREHVANLPFREALINFAYGYELINPQKIRETIEECMKNTPMQYIFEAKYMSSDGKTVGVRPSLMATGEEYEKAMALHMVDHANRFDLSMRVRLYISPAHQQIWNDHHPIYADLNFIVRNNPFIPPGHEEAYLRGILAGFIWDWVVAAYLLVPQVEASIRYVLKRSGIITSTVLASGIQEEKSLHQLLAMPETGKIFGNQIVFELKALLIEDLGGNLRNNLAHGMLTDNECYAEHMVNLWWLILRLSLIPTLKIQGKANKEM